MRRIRIVIATLAVGLLAGGARAGVYNLEDPPPRYPPLGVAHKDIRLVLDPLRVAALPVVPELPTEGYSKLAAELEAKADDQRTAPERLKLGVCYLRLGRPVEAARVLRTIEDKDLDLRTRLYLQEAELESKAAEELTTADRINLGACYLRLGRPNDAERVLSKADQRHFLVLANLAAAYQALNMLDRAVVDQGLALDAWPSVQPGWSEGELVWFRRVEGYNLKLLKLRWQEGLANPTSKAWDKMDLLFDKPRVPAEYGPQVQPWKLWGELPPDAYAIVGQLLVWQPGDDRLYWQLGELLNVLGNVQEAYNIFDELISARNESTVRELKEHRKILGESLDFANAVREKYLTDPAGAAQFQTDFHNLMWAVSPRGLMLAPPGAGDAAGETAMAASAQAYGMQQQTQQQGAAPPTASRRGWWPDWQPIFVGFAAGLIVATLGALQWTEWRRRRHAAPPRPAAETSPSPRTEPAVHDAGAFRSDAPDAPDRVEGAP